MSAQNPRDAQLASDTVVPFARGQPSACFWIDGDSVSYANSIPLASSLGINTGNILNFNARFGSTFDECRILEVRFEVRPCSSNNTGSTVMWVEPISNAVPTATLAQTNAVVEFSNGGNDKVIKYTYRPADYAYLDFIPCSTTTANIGYLNFYTDTTNFGSYTIANNTLFVLRAHYCVQFRGYA